MGCPIAELQKRMTHREFTYWCSVWQKRRFDDEIWQYVMAALRRDVQMFSGMGRKGPPPKVEKLIPYKQSPRQDFINSEFFS